jgi:hypothetical protein
MFRDIPFLKTHFIIETTFLQWRTNTKVTTIMTFTSFTQHVSRRVPKDHLTLIVFKVEQLELTGLFQRTCQIPKFTVDLGNDGTFSERLGNTNSNRQGSGFPRGTFLDSAVGQSNSNGFARLFYNSNKTR